MKVASITYVLIALLMLAGSALGVADDSTLIADKQNAIIFIRHALAPGTGDPAVFDISDCSTQRNLSQQGRQQAHDIGKKLRDLGVTDVPVYTSEWCRCRETADLMADVMNAGPVEDLALLNSFFATPADGPQQLQKLRRWLSTASTPLVLVTHQVVITGMTDVYPASGEMVVTTLDTDGALKVVSTVATEIR